MKVQVLHIDECPNWEEAGARTRHALDAVGLPDVAIEYVLIRTAQDAAHTGFAGSPTITVDGEDLFPSIEQTPNLACRIYPTSTGLAGTPTQQQLEQALRDRN